MESPVRKMQKRNDYNRHKLLRKIKRRRKAAAEQQAHAAEKALKKKLRITPPKFKGGKNPKDIDITYVDNPTYNEELGLFKDDNGRVVGDSIVLPELEVTPQLSRVNEFRDQRKRFHYEQPLETVSPEFEALALGRGLWNDMFFSTIKRPINITTDNAKNATDEMWDNAYFYALKKNDKEELQRLRDLHFKTKATSPILDESGNPLTTYHTVGDKYDPSFNTFDQSIEGQHTGIFTTDNPIMSASYTNQIVSKKEQDCIIEAIRQRELKKVSRCADDYQYKKWAIDKYSDKKKAKKQILKDHPSLKNIDPRQRQKELYLNLENPVVIDGEGTWWNNIPLEKAPQDLRIYPIVDRRTNNGPVMSTRSIDRVLGGYPETMPRTKYDSAIFKNIDDYGGSKYISNEFNKPGTVFDVQNSSALKYSDAITYDDFGKIIPLSKRDNFNINDLRYVLPITPIVAGTISTNKSRFDKGKNTAIPRFRGGKSFLSTAKSVADDINENKAFQFVKALDPTGVTSWYDVGNAAYDMYKNPNMYNAANLVLEGVGAIPLFGKVGKALKLGSAYASAKRISRINPQMGQYMIRGIEKEFARSTTPLHGQVAKMAVPTYLGTRYIGLEKDLYDSEQYQKSKKK